MTEDEHVLEMAVLTQVSRLSALIYGIVSGLTFGIVLFVATNWLVLRGGKVVGPHLSLLGQFFPGYAVTVWGSVVGFVYAFCTAFLVTYLIATLYNALVNLKEGKGRRQT